MTQVFAQHLIKNFQEIKPDSHLLVAFSGGVDSVVLTALLHKLGYPIYLAHVNFNLRNYESDKDMAFAKAFADRLNIPVYIHEANTKGYAKQHNISTQEAARAIRYKWFKDLISQNRLDFILTAHHADDLLETVMINLVRGSGLKGFTGIPEKRDNILRPLLPYAKKELYDYAKHENLTWREDLSNQSEDYLRNRIRQKVIPPLKKSTENAFKQAIKSINLAKSSYVLFDKLLDEKLAKISVFKDSVYWIDIHQLKKETQAKTLLFHLLNRLDIYRTDDIFKLLNAQKGKYVADGRYKIIRERDHLVIKALEATQAGDDIEIPLQNGCYDFANGQLKLEFCSEMGETSKNIAYLDADLLKEVLILRQWRNGDYFKPLGIKGTKKVSDFLKDNHIAHFEKKNQWVLLHNKSIIWLVNHQIDDRFKIKKNTTRCLKITYLNT